MCASHPLRSVSALNVHLSVGQTRFPTSFDKGKSEATIKTSCLGLLTHPVFDCTKWNIPVKRKVSLWCSFTLPLHM